MKSKHLVRYFVGPSPRIAINTELHARLYNHPSSNGRRYQGCCIVTPSVLRNFWIERLNTPERPVYNTSVITPELFLKLDLSAMRPTLILVSDVLFEQRRKVFEFAFQNRIRIEHIG